MQGNLLLDRLMGADVTILNVLDEELQPHLEAKAEELAQGRAAAVPHLLLRGGDAVAGGARLCRGGAGDLRPARARAGLHLRGGLGDVAGRASTSARARSALPTRVVSVSPIVYPEPRDDEIARICNAIAERLGLDARFAPADILVDDVYIGEAYGIVSTPGARR